MPSSVCTPRRRRTSSRRILLTSSMYGNVAPFRSTDSPHRCSCSRPTRNCWGNSSKTPASWIASRSLSTLFVEVLYGLIRQRIHFYHQDLNQQPPAAAAQETSHADSHHGHSHDGGDHHGHSHDGGDHHGHSHAEPAQAKQESHKDDGKMDTTPDEPVDAQKVLLLVRSLSIH